ncbi:MAG: hypothetical protein NTW87_13960 [Planctomycetota bacterium]|nr:hypothetical protein [Planctomycetota bacterium]
MKNGAGGTGSGGSLTPIALAVAIVLVAGCGEKKKGTPATAPVPRLLLELKATDPDKPLPERGLVLTFTNNGKESVRLDGRLLNPILLTDVTDSSGQLVPNMPPSVPRSFVQSDLVEVKPQKSLDLRFTLSEIIMAAFDGPVYKVRCNYDTLGVDYPPGLSASKVNVSSDQVVLTQTAKAQVTAGIRKPAERISLPDAEELVRAYIFAQKATMNPAAQFPLKEITPADVFAKLNCQVFQVTKGIAMGWTFLIHRGQAHPLGRSFGGWGVMSMCVADLDKDGTPELLYSYSYGSGIHRSHVAACRFLAEGVQEAQAPFAYRSDMFVKKADDGTVTVEVGEFSDRLNEWTPDTTLGKLEMAAKGNTLSLDVKLSENLPEAVRQAIWRPTR